MMKGMLKRALGVVAAAAMAVTGAVALSGTANAAVGDIVTTPATITINAGDESQFTGRDLKYIKLAEYDKYEADGQSSVLSIHTVDTVDTVRDYVKKALKTATDDKDPETPSYDADKDGDPMAWIANHLGNSGDAPYSGVLRDFVTELYNTDGFGVNDDMPTPIGSGVSRTYTMATPGVYLIVDKGASSTTNPSATQAIPMLVGTTIQVKKGSGAKVPGKPTYESDQDYGVLAGQVNLKNELTPVTKTVTGEGADETPSVGDTRTYTITGKVPNWVGKDLSATADPRPVFSFKDTPGKGQTVDFSSIKVYVDENNNGKAEEGESITAYDQGSNPNGYVLTGTGVFASPTGSIDADFVSGSDPQVLSSFTVTLTAYMKTIAQDTEYIGKPVVLTYDVTVNADAVNLEGNIANTVEVNNNGSTNEASASLPKPQTITFRKTDRDDKALANAQFSLAKGSTFVKVAETKADTTGSYIVDPDGVEADGKSTTTGEGDAAETKPNPLVSGTNGMVTVAGLGEGTYTVTETHAPDGFIEVGLPSFTVTIGHDQHGKSTIKYDETNDPFDLITITGTVGSQTVSIKNVRSITQLPLTGAAGTMLFTVLGLLIAGAGALVYAKSRNIRKAMH
ncbi:isopeptide-forming domain-containing fimbrial protein [Bifidobacterium pullorum subsp. saeculare]|uniref:SpaA isopeptide-forming pilin-related protein n=1 Tax=Bifidobacterium pullorum TaxID=78448 RepID=UPI001956D265|nr:SpaA isopeptide-forming pilin-related protein [Bifidobacterium pullorum]MBM6730672.1 isopeptide-forming domain-containing fimbrial protein [Bifidobacterium pullorum subsp. saeculare]